MAQENLRGLLAQLHTRLGQARSLDAESRRLLTTLSRDIERALGRASEETAPARNNLESVAVKLEAEHPGLAGAVRQLIDALGKAGI
jgi:chromosome segregation ATPase